MENDNIFIIGGGPSLKNFDFSRLKDRTTIVVNKAIQNVPDPNYFITMDFSFFSKVKDIDLTKCSATKVFIANLWPPYMQEKEGRIVDTRFPKPGIPGLVYDLEHFDMVIKTKAHPEGFGRTFPQFCTGLNSGFCALQFAVLMGYKNIYMLGIDLRVKDTTHYHGGYGEQPNKFGEKLTVYNRMFLKGIAEFNSKFLDFKVYSCSPLSVLNDMIDYVPFEEAIRL